MPPTKRPDPARHTSETPLGQIGCYTTTRVTGGRVERVERHVQRLRRDAKRLGLEQPHPREIEALLLKAAREAFGRGDGIVRIEWSGASGEAPRLVTTPRDLGPDPKRWRARCSRTIHPGSGARFNTKFVDVDAYDLAREEVRQTDIDEVLLFDADGFLVEGGHSNFLLIDGEGRLVTPDPQLGAVEGLGLTLVREHRPEIRNVRLRREAIEEAAELMSVNAVRGVVPIIELDGEIISGGAAGPWARRLRTIFFRE